MSASDQVPDLRATGKLLSSASDTVSGSGAPLFHTLAGSVSTDLSLVAVSADEMVLLADLDTTGARFREQARELRSRLAAITRQCGG